MELEGQLQTKKTSANFILAFELIVVQQRMKTEKRGTAGLNKLLMNM